ncbi:MAG: hypothetical protein ACM33T_01665 [Solirubrobacterales bacterium]
MSERIETWALVQAGEVVNLCVWDGDFDTWAPPAGTEAVRLAKGQPCDIGWIYDGAGFAAPADKED